MRRRRVRVDFPLKINLGDEYCSKNRVLKNKCCTRPGGGLKILQISRLKNIGFCTSTKQNLPSTPRYTRKSRNARKYEKLYIVDIV